MMHEKKTKEAEDPVVVIEPELKQAARRRETVTAESAAAKVAAIDRHAAAVARIRAGMARVQADERRNEELQEARELMERETPDALTLIEELRSRAESDEAVCRLEKIFQLSEEEKMELAGLQKARRERFDAIVRGEGKADQAVKEQKAAPKAWKSEALAALKEKPASDDELSKPEDASTQSAASRSAASQARFFLLAGVIGAMTVVAGERLTSWIDPGETVLYCDPQAVKSAALQAFLASPAELSRLRRDWEGCWSEGLARLAAQSEAVIIDKRALLASGRAADASSRVLDAVLEAARRAQSEEAK